MDILNKMKEIIKGNDKLCAMTLYVKNHKDPNLLKLIKGYYIDQTEYTPILIEHKGMKLPDELVYYIKYPPEKKGTTKKAFCATLRVTLDKLLFSDNYKMLPVVEWGENLTFYDPGMDYITKNVFEYYFEPVSGIAYGEVKNFRNVVNASNAHGNALVEHPYGYRLKQYEIEKLGEIYKKYIHLNKTTKEYIEGNLDNVLSMGKILGIHARGTDFNVGASDHPMVITPKEYIIKTKELFASGKYDKIFLATDDANILELFEKELGTNLLYYKDVFRSTDHRGSHIIQSDQPLHYYKQGLEVLRDVYTLANCASLICGLSQVSFAARYVNFALDRKFHEVVICDNGITTEDSDEAKMYRREAKIIMSQNRSGKNPEL